MHRISRAPVLSATLSRVSAWIIGRTPTGLLHDLEQAPALGARQRPALDDAHDVSLAGLVALVVGVQRAAVAHDLAVHAVRAHEVDPDGDRLVRPCSRRPRPDAPCWRFRVGGSARAAAGPAVRDSGSRSRARFARQRRALARPCARAARARSLGALVRRALRARPRRSKRERASLRRCLGRELLAPRSARQPAAQALPRRAAASPAGSSAGASSAAASAAASAGLLGRRSSAAGCLGRGLPRSACRLVLLRLCSVFFSLSFIVLPSLSSASRSMPRSRATVSVRASERRASRRRAVFSSSPVELRKRRLKSSSRNSRTFSTSCSSFEVALTSFAFTSAHWSSRITILVLTGSL